jgi:hypothetical protein
MNERWIIALNESDTLVRSWFPLAKYIAYANGEVEDQKSHAPELTER